MRTLTMIALGLIFAMGASGVFAHGTLHKGHGATSATSASSGSDQHGSDAMRQSMMTKIHHQQVLDMAQTERAHAKSAAIKEIGQFDQWLAKLK